jgi:hypothetical protein
VAILATLANQANIVFVGLDEAERLLARRRPYGKWSDAGALPDLGGTPAVAVTQYQ